MIDFPNSPTIGQKYTAANKTWEWDGAAWIYVPTTPAPPEEWLRPAEWMPMPEVSPTEDKFVGLIAVFDTDANYVELKADSASVSEYTVDWGDGLVEDFVYGDTATHQYSFTNTSLTDTSATLDYKQAMVVVTPKEGSGPWTYFSLQEGAIPGGIFIAPVNWLDIAFSGPNVTTLKIGLVGV